MPKYKRTANFPTPFIPGALEIGLKDPFGATLGQQAGGPQMTPTGGGGGGGFPDLDVVNGLTGAVISAGTETLTAGGKNIVWVQMNVNNNGAANFMLFLGSLPYA